uniref:Uncharacterized protein n=1 Tax=Glossina brevipalpis TaxID=37001 RepID=A0A1A9WXC7_9MUSC
MFCKQNAYVDVSLLCFLLQLTIITQNLFYLSCYTYGASIYVAAAVAAAAVVFNVVRQSGSFVFDCHKNCSSGSAIVVVVTPLLIFNIVMLCSSLWMMRASLCTQALLSNVELGHHFYQSSPKYKFVLFYEFVLFSIDIFCLAISQFLHSNAAQTPASTQTDNNDNNNFNGYRHYYSYVVGLWQHVNQYKQCRRYLSHSRLWLFYVAFGYSVTNNYVTLKQRDILLRVAIDTRLPRFFKP